MDEHHAMRLLRDHPEISFGVHLTVVCDTDGYGWGPLAPRERVPSLVDGAGFFPPPKGIPELLARAELDELELEFRTQIDAVLSPTHLDWHCLENGGRADVFDMTCRLAREHGLAVRADYGPWTSGLRQRGLPVADQRVVDSFDLEVDDKPAAYVRLLSDLPPGLNLWAVHPGVGDPELQAAEPDGWRVRETDLEFLVSEQARDLIHRKGIVLLDHESLQRAWRNDPL